MSLVSYAQNGEDVVLNRLFPDAEGVYIDVGANDPVESSVTKLFYDRGWRGINVEPEPAAFARMVAGRPLDRNLNLGISAVEGVLTFYDVPDANGWSTFSPAQAENLRREGMHVVEREIPVVTLASLCERYLDEGRGIDFLKVDAESHEAQVMAGADWSRWRPRVVLIEANGMVDWEPGLLASGYLFGLFDGINRYYVREEDRHFLPNLATCANFSDFYIPHAYERVIAALQGQIRELEGRLDFAERELHGYPRWVRKIRRITTGQSSLRVGVAPDSRRAG